MKRLGLAAVVAALCAAPIEARAFCGFYVNGAGGELFNNATQVVRVRHGTRTVLAMQNNYQGPPQDFAMVIPVPVVLHDGDVKTLTKESFHKVDAMGAPRLVEYCERDPCWREDRHWFEGRPAARRRADRRHPAGDQRRVRAARQRPAPEPGRPGRPRARGQEGSVAPGRRRVHQPAAGQRLYHRRWERGELRERRCARGIRAVRDAPEAALKGNG